MLSATGGIIALELVSSLWFLVSDLQYMEGFPSGQRGQTVNLLSVTSVVRIHPPPPQKYWMPLIIKGFQYFYTIYFKKNL